MPLQKFIFNPGINKEGTDYTAEGGWFDGNLVRFRKGLPEKIGGWQKYIQASYEGTGRKLFDKPTQSCLTQIKTNVNHCILTRFVEGREPEIRVC